MWGRLVPPVKPTVKQRLFESSIHDQVISGREISLKAYVDVRQLLPGSFCRSDFLVKDEEPKVRECELRRKRLLQRDQAVPSVLGSNNFIFRDKQTQERQVEVRTSRQCLVKHLIGISGRVPAKLKGRVDSLGIIRKDYVEVVKGLSDITLDQEEVGRLPRHMWRGGVGFHCPFHALFLRVNAPCYLISTRQIQPVSSLEWIQTNCCQIV